MRVVALLVVVALMSSPTAVLASPQVREFDTGGVLVSDHLDARPAADGTGAPGRQVYSYWWPAPAGEGFCRARRYTYDRSEAEAYNYAYNRLVAEANGVLYPDCPPNPTTAPQPPTPGDLARAFWDVRHLPSPTLEVVPDYAVTGKRVYLTIKGAPTATFDVANPIGPSIAIAATSHYIVDWGDGTPPTTTTSQGGPWPEGDITHVYDGAGMTRTITVTQSWSATWSAGGTQGALDNLHTVGALPLRVEQVQAVRNR